MKIIKKILVAILVIIAFLFMTCEPSEPQGNLTPYMSDVVMIPQKVYAKGKPQKIKKKTLKRQYDNLGEFTLTAYCSCSKCCGKWSCGKTASGVKAKSNHTIAVDKKVIPLGSKVVINGIEYTAEDTGGGVKGKHIDIFFDSHSDALDFGRQKATVYMKKPPKLISKFKTMKRSVVKELVRVAGNI